MTRIGYTLSSEEFRPHELVEHAQMAERAGFTYAFIADHFHPWLDSQGQSPFVWTTLGGVAHATSELQVGTGVTAPIIRVHPAIMAQAAATVADMMPGRFFFGVGTGEKLNEHVTGEKWPPISVRLEMLAEAIYVIRELWEGGYKTFHGDFYAVENARIYTLPEELPPILMAADGPKSAGYAGQLSEGLISTAPKAEAVNAFNDAGGTGKPRYGQLQVCWAEDEEAAKQTAWEYWRYTALPGQLNQELALPAYFEQATQLVTVEQVAQSVVCGPDPEKYVSAIKSYEDAGFDHVYMHQIGPDQQGFIDFAKRELLPKYQ